MREPIFETVNGRVIWRMESSPSVEINPIIASSPVSFPDEATARLLFSIIDTAPREDQSRGHTWRRLLSASTFNELLGYAADMDERCSFTGSVVRSPIGAGGNNWSIDWDGTDSRTKQLMHNAVTRLRQQFNLAT